MKEIIKNFSENINDRLKNPLLFSFIIAFIVCNWKALAYFFFAHNDIVEKLEIISSNYYSWVTGLGIPLMIAFFYSLGLPYINVGIEWLLIKKEDFHDNNISDLEINRRHKEKIELEHRIGLERLETELREHENATEEIKRLESDVKERDERIFKLVHEHEDQNSSLNKMMDDYRTELNKNQEIIRGLELELNKEKSSSRYAGSEAVMLLEDSEGLLKHQIESTPDINISPSFLKSFSFPSAEVEKMIRLNEHVQKTVKISSEVLNMISQAKNVANNFKRIS